MHHLLQSEDVRTKLIATGYDEVLELIHDIEERSVQAGFTSVQRPHDGCASSPAFDRNGSAASGIRRAYTAAKGLMYGAVVPLDDCLASVRRWAELL